MTKPKKNPAKMSSRDRERARERDEERHRAVPQPDGAPEPPTEAAERERHFVNDDSDAAEERVDETVEESFPASDPPAHSGLGHVGSQAVAPSGGIHWLRDLAAGLAEARAQRLPVLLDFSAAPT